MGWIFLPIMSLIFSSDLDTSASKWSPAAEEGKAVESSSSVLSRNVWRSTCVVNIFFFCGSIGHFLNVSEVIGNFIQKFSGLT